MSKKKRRYRMTSLKLDEISAVDRPAQEGAKAMIFKRADLVEPAVDTTKSTALTSAEDGHTHLLNDSNFDGDTTSGGETSWNAEHYHPWARAEGGAIEIGETDGHSHTLAGTQTKSAQFGEPTKVGDTAQAINATKDMEMSKAEKTEELAAVEKKLADAVAYGELTDAQKAYHSGLDADGKARFVKASAEERSTEVAKATEADPVVYTADDGTEFRKSADPAMVTMAKRLDASERERRTEVAKTEALELCKRVADEIPHLPGTEAVKCALLKAVDGIKDEELRKGAKTSLKADNSAMSEAFKEAGTTGGGKGAETSDPLEKLKALATDRASKESISFEKAYEQVTDTPEGKALYNEIESAR